MSGYGFGKRLPSGTNDAGGADALEPLDFSGIERRPLTVDPAREEAAIRRGDALGFVDRAVRETDDSGAGAEAGEGERTRRRRAREPQISVYIKGPKDTLEWFIDYTNRRGHRSYWESLEELRSLAGE